MPKFLRSSSSKKVSSPHISFPVKLYKLTQISNTELITLVTWIVGKK